MRVSRSKGYAHGSVCVEPQGSLLLIAKVKIKTMQKALTMKTGIALVAFGAVLAVSFAFAASAQAQTSCNFTRSLTVGSTGAEVMSVQQFLNANGAQVSATGAGSPGNESSYFGAKTKAAVAKFQAANGISPTAGYWGPLTRAAANAKCGTTPTPGPVVSGAVNVGAATQPANSLAPQGASRVPFTTFTLTNGSSAAVTINGVTVQRVGLGQDAVFSGIVLVDSNNVQVGTSKTLNSNHQATVGDTFTLNAGETRTFTVAGNMGASLAAYAGQVVGLSVVGVNTTATVSGSLPITGAQQTINATLTLGSVSTSTSAYDPGSATTKNIGDTAIKFSGIKFTAGSTEDIKLYSIRWRQVGSVSSSDLANVMTFINGTSYPTTVDSTGKYYTTVFPGGILITKGNSADLYVQGDVVGSNASSRTADFDLDKVTDVYFVGQTYGYGIAPSGTYTPWYNGYVVTLSGASVTTIGKDTGTANAAQNVAINVANQPLGGYIVDLKGEPISVQSTVFTIATSSASVGLLTNVSLVDENGAVVAGPVDATWSSGTSRVTFTDTVTYPLGRHVYSLRGKVPTGASNGATITLSTIPSSQWTSITGQTTGNSVTLSNGSFSLNTMTVKSGALAVSVASTPVAQSIIAGAQGVVFANINLDATQSGEDVRLASIPLTIDNGNNSLEGAATNLSTCQLWDGATALNGGSNVVNPTTSATTSAVTAGFTLDSSLTVAKGTTKTLAVKCNVSSSADASSQFQIGMTSAQATGLSVTGVTSGSTVSATDGGVSNGQIMTIASAGTLTATAASTAVAQPALALVAAGTSGVTMGSVKFTATNEDIQVQKIGLTLANGTYGSANRGAAGNSGHASNDDVVTAYIYNGATLVGTASFTAATATSTLSTPVTVPANGSVTLTIKANLASIGVSDSAGIGDTVKVDPLNAQGLGLASSQQVNISATAGVNGVQIFESVPTVALGTGACSGTGCNGTNQVIKSLNVTANAAGPISVEQLKFDVATSSASLTSVSVVVYDNAGNVATSTFGAQDCASGCTAAQSAGTAPIIFTGGPVIIPAGTTYNFKLVGTVTPGGSATNWSVNATLQGDSAAVAGIGSSPITIGTTTAVANADAQSGFIWSDNATTTATLGDVDWFNGYQVSGLPSIGL